ncbi:alpha/beta fold hydrolase [Lentzea sp. NEAU-D7]|uniref:alpha/beta fold hydrolase n=1 Tax=Lentzea sp. NEAU-D7 TaxID=2994667 RepID=UPI00224A91DA|nr:hypothetical protein [Lentzea sp. NEAU-D7]MCX2955029.1 hypothetical protein [Lentzea sp. NEAU-D7]
MPRCSPPHRPTSGARGVRRRTGNIWRAGAFAVAPANIWRVGPFAAAPAIIWHAEAMPGYPRRLAEVRFGTEWLRQLQTGTLVTRRLPDAAQRIAELDIPALVLHGCHDMTFPVGLVQPTLDLIPRARAVVPWCWRTRATCCTSTIPTIPTLPARRGSSCGAGVPRRCRPRRRA